MTIDHEGDGTKPSRPLASWYTQARSDGLGDRLVMSDNTGTASLELLRFKPEFTAFYGFESALRERVEQLGRLQHPPFPRIHAVEFLDEDEGLTLVSTHIAGKRLSSLLQAPIRRVELHVGLATWLIGQLTAAIADLHGHGGKLAHGALSSDRIILTPDRRLFVVEHVLGSALARLELPAHRLWSDVGVIVPAPDTGAPQLDCRADVVQIGLIGLSVLLGRRITPTDYPQHLDALLDEFSSTAGRWSPAVAASLRLWFERALGPDARGFRTARDARDGFRELPGDIAHTIGELPPPGTVSVSEPTPRRPPPRALSDSIETAIDDVEVVERPSSLAKHRSARRRARTAFVPALAVLFALVSVGEAVVIKRLLEARRPAAMTITAPLRVESREPGEVVLIDGQQVGVTPMELKTSSEGHTIRIGHPDVPPLRVAASLPVVTSMNVSAKSEPTPKVDSHTLTAIADAAARQRSGGLRLVSPIDLQVLEGERVLGSSADGPVVTTAGRHELDLVNNTLGYRSRHTVDIRAGQIISLPVSPPDGRISINAQPWAQVWIDGNPVGDTPLAYLPVPVGDHEIVFRHPQLGEHREMAVVRSNALTRVTATLSR